MSLDIECPCCGILLSKGYPCVEQDEIFYEEVGICNCNILDYRELDGLWVCSTHKKHGKEEV